MGCNHGHILGKLVKKTVKYIKKNNEGNYKYFDIGGGVGFGPPTKLFVITTIYVVSRHIDHLSMGVMVILRLTWEL